MAVVVGLGGLGGLVSIPNVKGKVVNCHLLNMVPELMLLGKITHISSVIIPPGVNIFPNLLRISGEKCLF